MENTFVFKNFSSDWSTGIFITTYEHRREDGRVFEFKEKFVFPVEKNAAMKPPLELEKMLFLLAGISYYKLYCPKNIHIEGFELTQEQAGFWNTVYMKGLGEFFYRNTIDFRGLISFPYSENATHAKLKQEIGRPQKALVPVGGGKDSCVTVELLKETGWNLELFSLNSYPIIENVVSVISLPLHTVKRTIDPLLIELNKNPDTYNGHIPVTAIYTVCALIFAYMNNYSHVVFSNEKSSNFGNVTYHGELVSHQWSKSYECEVLISQYVKKFITTEVDIFSLLRPMYEIKIAEIFAKFPEYFEVFSSSNHNFTLEHHSNPRGRWDYESPKTIFVYILLAAFLDEVRMMRIFGALLFDEDRTLEITKELLGLEKVKPWECVGTPEEVLVALHRVQSQGKFSSSLVMDFFAQHLSTLSEDTLTRAEQEVFSLGTEHHVPSELILTLEKHFAS